MEDLKLEDDDHVPQAFGVGPIPKFLASRELGLVGRRHLTFQLPKEPKEPSFDEILRCPRESLLLETVEISPGLKAGQNRTSANRQADEVGEERLVVKDLETLPCKLNGTHTRSTFLMVFSPDKELLASTHGDHNIYVSEVKTGKCVRTLSGHPRTPWCIAFHPSYPTVLASGCLGGLVRVWDILSGGSEVWRTDGVIASLAFHPFDRLLVVATFNELHFWDWSAASRPFAKVRTNSDKEKVRYVKFDSMGHHLITGIANLSVNRTGVQASSASGTTTGPTDRLMWVRTSGHSEFAAEHLYGGNVINRSRNLPFYHSDMALPRYGRYRRLAYTAQSPNSGGNIGRTTDRGTDPMLASTSTHATSSTFIPTRASATASLGRAGPSRRTNNSASQTLSDLAAAASNQLMVENAAAAAAAAASASSEMYFQTFDRWSSRLPPSSTPINTSTAASTATSSTAAAATARDLNDPSLPFTHSPQSSFREVAGVGEGQDDEDVNSLPSSTGATVGGDVTGAEADERIVYLQRRTDRNSRLQARLQAATNDRMREYRIQELLDRRESLVSQIEELRTARDILTSQNNGNSSASAAAADEATRRTSGASPTLATTDPLFEPPTRPIDEWAINRRLSIESNQLSESVDELRFGREQRNSNVRATLLIDYLNRDPTLRGINGSASADSIPDPLRALPEIVEPEVIAEPESLSQDGLGLLMPGSESDQVRNDHTYVQRPREAGLEDDDLDSVDPNLAAGSSEGAAGTSAGSASNASLLGNHNMDIVLLSRHIAHMQRICRTSLQDCTRQRRQVVRLQSIRRMLEDLQRQIRSLRAASLEELQRRNSNSTENDSTQQQQAVDDYVRPRSNASSNVDNDSENLVRTSPGNLLDDRNYDERVGEGEHLAQLRTNSLIINSTLSRLNRAASSTSSSVARRTGPLSATALRSGRSPSSLMRAHNRFLSQMRATFRALEMNPSLTRTGTSPINLHNAEVSRNVMESLQAASTPSLTSTATAVTTTAPTTTATFVSESNNARGELRALSQRLELELRTRRETPGGEAQNRLDFEESRRLETVSRPWLFTNTFLDSESESDSEAGRANLDPASAFTGPARYLPWSSSLAQNERYDLYSNYPPQVSSVGTGRRPVASRSLNTTSERWRTSSIQDRVESWRELRREAIRERKRVSAFLHRERNDLRRRRRHRLLDSSPNLSHSYRYTFHRNYPFMDQQQDEEEDLDQESRDVPRPRGTDNVGGSDIAVDDEDEASSNGTGNGNSERLPPLRELIWRRLRRRNAQLNMLEEEMSNGSNPTDGSRPGAANERSTRHRELLSWMVDQMRLDHVPPTSSTLGTAGTNSESGSLDREPSPSVRVAPDSPPRFTIRMRRNAENSASDNSPSVGTASGTQGSGNPSARVILPGINPLPPINVPYRLNTNQRDQQHFFLSNTPATMLLTHRIQAWDFSKGDLPDISDENKNVIVKEAKIHNDASVDISEDGTILVTLVPSNLPMTTVVGVYGLQPDSNRGRCYATYSLESSAVSVSLSPTSRHLLVGLAIRAGRITLSPADRSLMAQIFRIKLPWDRNAERGRLVHRRDIHQTHEQGQTSLNCIRWIPVAGQGIVYATNTGLLKILR